MENFKFIALTDEQLSSASLSKCAHCIVNTVGDSIVDCPPCIAREREDGKHGYYVKQDNA